MSAALLGRRARRAPRRRRRARVLASLAVAASATAPGCYWTHLVSGQLQLLYARSPSARVQSDPATPHRLREQLALVGETRAFADALGLDVGGRYTSYVDWPGDRVVTTVVATRPGEIEPAGFAFPIVGRVPYKGFFDRERAEGLAEELRATGHDVCVSPVDAYSTLGWFDDPVTAPMLQRTDAALVETVLHELVHATVFVESQPEFNEGVARFFAQEATVAFFAARDGDASGVHARVEENRALDAALLAFRARVAALYAAESDPARRAARRVALEADARASIAALDLADRDPEELAASARLGDACVALRGTYAEDAPRHAAVLASLGGDLPAFLARLRAAAGRDDPRSAFFGDVRAAP